MALDLLSGLAETLSVQIEPLVGSSNLMNLLLLCAMVRLALIDLLLVFTTSATLPLTEHILLFYISVHSVYSLTDCS